MMIDEEKKQVRRELSKLLFDWSKVAFTAMVVGGIVLLIQNSYELKYLVLLLFGVIFVGVLVFIGYKLFIK
jgi:hypothetical protein